MSLHVETWVDDVNEFEADFEVGSLRLHLAGGAEITLYWAENPGVRDDQRRGFADLDAAVKEILDHFDTLDREEES